MVREEATTVEVEPTLEVEIRKAQLEDEKNLVVREADMCPQSEAY
jgi:hypothetical protein